MATEIYYPENVDSINSFTDNLISSRDQIPGNSQEMV
jgi:hypothetical protein